MPTRTTRYSLVKIIVVDPEDPQSVVEVIGRLRNKVGLLDKIGALMVRDSQRAFREQALGDIEWEPRYPNQEEPFVNVAGVVSDLYQGATVKKRRFDNRPAGSDTGTLRKSVDWQIVGEDSVEVGSSIPYAGRFHHGGVSFQAVTDTVKEGLRKWLGTKKRTPKRYEERKKYRPKLGWLLNKKTTLLRTEQVARPFVGVTPKGERDIVRTVERHVAGEPL